MLCFACKIKLLLRIESYSEGYEASVCMHVQDNGFSNPEAHAYRGETSGAAPGTDLQLTHSLKKVKKAQTMFNLLTLMLTWYSSGQSSRGS